MEIDSNKIRAICLQNWKNRGEITQIMLGDKIIAMGCGNESCLFMWMPNNSVLPNLYAQNNLESLSKSIDTIIENVSKIYSIPKEQVIKSTITS